jgi:hypothetical protein
MRVAVEDRHAARSHIELVPVRHRRNRGVDALGRAQRHSAERRREKRVGRRSAERA